MAGEELDRGEDSPAVRRQLAGYYRDMIEAGELGPGEHLPSAGQMAQLHGVHRDTALAALRILASEGLVRTLPRAGTVVAGEDPVAEHVIEGPARITVRMPTAPERAALDVPPGVPMLVVARPGAVDQAEGPEPAPPEVTQYLGHVSVLVIV